MNSIIFIFLFITVALIISLTRNGKAFLKRKPNKLKNIVTTYSPEKIFSILVEEIPKNGYKIDALDEKNFSIIFSEPLDFTSWGFFYPVYIEMENYKTIISIGIKSKVFQIGPIRNKKYEKMMNNIRSLVNV